MKTMKDTFKEALHMYFSPLAKVKDFIFAVHRWYDGLKEPKRFLTFIIPLAIFFAGVNCPSLKIAAVSWILIIFGVITRIAYLSWGRKD